MQMSVEELLNLKASEFADTETQKTREKERSNAEQSVLLTTSRNEDMNSKIRAVMSGSSEDWRSKNSMDADDSGSEMNYNESSSHESKKRKLEPDSKPTSRSEEIEKAVTASLSQTTTTTTPSRKRSLDVDAGTRISASNVNKLPKLDISDPPVVVAPKEPIPVSSTPVPTPTTESPKTKIESPRVKAPNLLDILKANPNNNINNSNANSNASSTNNSNNISNNNSNNNKIILPEPIRDEDIRMEDTEEDIINYSGGNVFVLKYTPKSSGITHSIQFKGLTKDR